MRPEQKLAMAKLDGEWQDGTIRHVDEYKRRSEQILAQRAPTTLSTQTDDVYVKRNELRAELDALVDPLTKFIEKFNQQAKDLGSRVTDLENRPQLEYTGVWSGSKVYKKAQIVTFNGSMWFAHQDTFLKPGTSAEWQLCVKAGRDAR